MIFYVGDTHGRVSDIKKIEEEALEIGAKVIIQVGDFGMFFAPSCKVAEWFDSRDGGLTWITCGGNHDNWPAWRNMPEVDLFDGKVRQLASGCFFAERGTVLNIGGENHLFFGGAESTDKWARSEGYDWWPEETPNQDEALLFFDKMTEAKPEVVVTHEAPLRVEIGRLNRDTNPTPRALENALKHCEHKPARWYFGHHHMLDSWEIEETTFYCCGLHGEYVSTRQLPHAHAKDE
jgi:hypothetical protein